MKEIIYSIWEMPAKDLVAGAVIIIAGTVAVLGGWVYVIHWKANRRWERFKKKNRL